MSVFWVWSLDGLGVQKYDLAGRQGKGRAEHGMAKQGWAGLGEQDENPKAKRDLAVLAAATHAAAQ